MIRYRHLGLLLGLASIACAPEFDVPSELTSLRILAVKKDKPYARPGDTVTLTMLDHDGSPEAPRAVNRMWLRGCENPPGDLYPGCFAQLGEVLAPAIASGDYGAALEYMDFGHQATVSISDDIISSRPPPTDPDTPRYGLAYEFFAICAGEFGFPPDSIENLAFPIGCYEADGTADGFTDHDPNRRLGQDDFVVGYTAVFVYEELTNRNPVFRRFEVEGQAIEEDCRGDACVPADTPPPAPPSDGGAPVSDGGAPAGGAADAGAPPAPSGPPPLGDDCDLSDPRCVAVCTRDEEDQCPGIDIQAVVDRRLSFEEDQVLQASGREGLAEQMWINYYVDRGSVSPAVKLLADANKGWNDEHNTTLRAPRESGPFHVWGVAHDNRGGVEWIRASFYARTP